MSADKSKMASEVYNLEDRIEWLKELVAKTSNGLQKEEYRTQLQAVQEELIARLKPKTPALGALALPVVAPDAESEYDVGMKNDRTEQKQRVKPPPIAASDSDDEDTQPNVSQDTVQSVGSQEPTTGLQKKPNKTPSHQLTNANRNLQSWSKKLSKLENQTGVEEELYHAKSMIAKHKKTVEKLETEIAKSKTDDVDSPGEKDSGNDSASADGVADAKQGSVEHILEQFAKGASAEGAGAEDKEELPGMKRKRKAYTVEGEAAAGKRDAVLDEFSSDEEDDFGENRNEPLPEKIDYERTTDPKTGQLKITMSVDDLQQIIGHMENVRPPVVEAWKCKTMYKAGFMSHLSPYAEDWQPGKSLKVQELTEQTSELHREKKAVGKLHKALPTIKVSFTGQDAEVIQLAHDVAILGVPVSGNATKGPGAPEQVLVYSSKPDAPVSEQEPDKKKNRKPTPKHIAEAATAGPSKTPISVD